MDGPELTHTDPSQNYIERYPQPLDPLFHPETIAVIGAKDTPGSVGRTIMANLVSTPFKGKIYPVNPKRDQVLGIKCVPSLFDIPGPIDLAVIVTPAATVPKLVAECVEAGVKSAIIISAGFKELGEPGQKLEEEILMHA
ncbi:MAG: CoA-binding protein, partial [Chlamydiales bacterium]